MHIFLILLFFLFCLGKVDASSIGVYQEILRYELCEYLEKKIEETQVIEEPFPHIVIENFFSEEFYQCALKYYPAEHQFYASRICPNSLNLFSFG